MKGYANRLLYVDLTGETVRPGPYPDDLKRDYLGGRGLGVRLLSEMIDASTEPLGPENVLIVASGPLSGSGVPLGSRFDVITRSPLNGTITSANSGGFFGKELKRAGVDGIIISGRAKRPTYLWIHNGETELRDGSAHWGKRVSETVQDIENETMGPKTEVFCIGPAGENLSPIASIMNETFRSAGRGGVGAVMGSKNLKAIAVRGEGTIEVADREALDEVNAAARAKLRENPVTGKGLPTYGTAVLVNIINEHHILPIKNFQSAHDPEASTVSGEELADRYLKSKKCCYSCMVCCGRQSEIDGVEGDGPEYETVWAFGPNLGCHDLGMAIRANNLCNELGLDTISIGGTLATAMEMTERGYADAGIRFGECEKVEDLITAIGLRQGIGDELAEGSYSFAARHGHPEVSMTVKRQELPAYDPRGLQGHGLAYATSVRGGDHVYGYMISPEVLGLPEALDPFTSTGKAEWTKIFQDLTAAIDASGICLFTSFALTAEDYATLIRGVTGMEITADDLMRIGERIWNLQRLWNLRAGYTKADDTLPHRLLTEPLREGAPAGRVWEREPLLSEYYAVRGWDEDGVPTAKKLAELGISTFGAAVTSKTERVPVR
ncbi:aldehyde ferredoxin oxidoreductase family protein [Methanofollis fontis]|uniref:Aldehyde ferredoxin oxidoreductase n=1 Tax=Methanofollis fontis TaxID=2052832 RepID=A0A483CQJ3_9EURY|nr:aldehyde ferredoxin oxidoreductase family protein [Methanofollis fontis]TAJ44955.1 aldehyde ferredoxin oxidoreductase [Methanofollis fontis]